MGDAATSLSSTDVGVGWEPVVRPLTGKCRRNFAQRSHACFGISPFNSYFSTSRITELARWGLRQFDALHFFLPDVPAAHTLEALGYAPERARHKARRQGRYVYNKICRALGGLGVTTPENLILDWPVLRRNGRYLQLLGQAHALFDEDPGFRDTCLAAAAWALEGRLPDGTQPADEQLRVAVRYLLAEFPLFVDTPGIIDADASVFCYHQAPPFLQRLYEGALPCTSADGQGFLVTLPPEGTR